MDYEGSRSTRPASVNYSMREYASDIVYTLGSVCRTEELPMPHIISESGRALTAHHALLLINVIDVESQVEPTPPKLREEPHPLLVEMSENLEGLTQDRIEEVFHDVVFAKERAQEYFASGVFSLRDKADADQLYLVTLSALSNAINEDKASSPRSSATSRRRWWTATSATFRSSSLCRTTGPSISSSPSCRSIGSTSHPPGGARCRTSPATRTA